MLGIRTAAQWVGDEAGEAVAAVHDEVGRCAVSLLTDRYRPIAVVCNSSINICFAILSQFFDETKLGRATYVE